MVKPKKTRTSHLSAAEKFEYYFDLRMRLLKSALRGVGNLSNRNVYEYPDGAKKKIESHKQRFKKAIIFSSSVIYPNLSSPIAIFILFIIDIISDNPLNSSEAA